MKEAGVILCDSNAQAVRLALAILDHPLTQTDKAIEAAPAVNPVTIEPTEAMLALLTNQGFINVGLRSFSEAIINHGGKVVQYDWQPVAGGNITLQKALQFLNKVALAK